MRPLSPRFLLRSRLPFSAVLLATVCLLGACDRHSAQEVPESYGHGSSHDKSYSDHQPDSRRDSKSFSDTQGLYQGDEKAEGTEGKEKAAASPAASPRFFPKGS